ncbi:hypothetical protein niasHT_039843 [Heterodera trifolii]|uniref:Serpentine receptor class gamma n=1 Tax=Heterodera trifolii TaxID=157864 RepID=A0ABD2IPZ9_9BILA
MENSLTIFLSLNHFTAILFPTKYEKLWRRGLVFVLGATFLLPLPLSFAIFNLDMYIHVQDDNVTFILDNHKMDNVWLINEINLTEITSWSSFAFGIICLLLKLASIFAYKLRKNGHQNSTIERKLTIYTMMTFFGHFIGTIFCVIVVFTSTNFVDEQNNCFSHVQSWFGLTLEENDIIFLANFNQFPWVNDLSTLAIPAWLLLWASTQMKEIIAKKFKWTRKTEHKANVAFVVPFSNKVHPLPKLLANHPK